MSISIADGFFNAGTCDLAKAKDGRLPTGEYGPVKAGPYDRGLV